MLVPAPFLRDYWQKKPLLVRGAFPKFKDPLTADELGGLSCEDAVESRIVRGKGKKWSVTWGPHPESRFSELPEREWTLLVQEVNRWVPEAALLLEPFTFIPNVRVDDVMVSYASPGGGVGPHIDSYDVFLVQGRGKRRWQYHSRRTKETALIEGLEMRVLAKFIPDRDEVLEAGDMLYIPPGFAHHGTAVTECMTYSIGFRSPSASEAWTSFAAAQKNAALLVDPPLKPAKNPGEIPRALRASVRKLVRSIDLSDEAIDRWYASFATRLKPGHALAAARPPKDLLARLQRGQSIERTEEGRWAYLERRGGLYLYVGGEEISVAKPAAKLAAELCAHRRLVVSPKNAAEAALLLDLFSRGALSLGALPASRR